MTPAQSAALEILARELPDLLSAHGHGLHAAEIQRLRDRDAAMAASAAEGAQAAMQRQHEAHEEQRRANEAAERSRAADRAEREERARLRTGRFENLRG